MTRTIAILFVVLFLSYATGCSGRPTPKATQRIVEMDEPRFWNIVERSRVSIDIHNPQETQCQTLRQILSDLPVDDVAAFDRRFTLLFIHANTWKLWDAINYMEGASDDSFMDFRYWLISQGRDKFYAVCENPDAVLAKYVGTNELVFFQDFGSVASEFLSDYSTHVDDLIPIGDPSTEGLPDNATDENLPERYPLITKALRELEEKQ